MKRSGRVTEKQEVEKLKRRLDMYYQMEENGLLEEQKDETK